MNSIQQSAMKIFTDNNIGAMITRFGWTWPDDIRNSTEKAYAVIEAYENLEFEEINYREA